MLIFNALIILNEKVFKPKKKYEYFSIMKIIQIL